MIDYKTFKKGCLTEWVDQSQAARKAAEELAMKEVKPSLRDIYKPELIFQLDKGRVEFKAENEKKPDGGLFFTWDEAMDIYGRPDIDGWRLPTRRELQVLSWEPYDGGVFDGRLAFPIAGIDSHGRLSESGCTGYYWTSSVSPQDPEGAYVLQIDSKTQVRRLYKTYGCSVRLVRDVK